MKTVVNSDVEGEHGGEANAELIVSDQGATAVTDDVRIFARLIAAV